MNLTNQKYNLGFNLGTLSCKYYTNLRGFNGQEKDDEINGSEGTSYSAPFWQYDSRIARRWNLDPKPNPSISPYACFAGNPIIYGDPLGDTIVIMISEKIYEKGVRGYAMTIAESDMVLNQVNDGVFIIISHGNPDGVQNDLPNDLPLFITDPKDFYELMNSFDEWKKAKEEKKEITLIIAACNTATEPYEYSGDEKDKGKKSFVQKLSEEDTEINVYGEDGYGIIGTITEKKGLTTPKGKVGLREVTNTGNRIGGLVKFKAGKKIEKDKIYLGKPLSNDNQQVKGSKKPIKTKKPIK